jgi:lipoprotein-releasing system permease protein
VYRLFLARRYMLARPVSYLAMAAIGCAVAALIVVISVMNGFLEETRSIVRGTTADIIVLPAQGGGAPPVSREAYESAIAERSGVAGVCSRLVRPAVVKVHGSANRTLGDTMFLGLNQVAVLGIDADDEMRVTGLSGYLADVENSGLSVGDPRQPFNLHRGLILDRSLRNADLPRVLVGEQRMKTLRLSKGDALELVTVPDDEDMSGTTIRSTTETFVIAGAFKTGHTSFDMGNIFIERDAFRAWTGTRQELSEMYVMLSEPERLDEVRDDIEATLAAAHLPAQVETWRQRHRVYLGAVENERNILGFVLSLFVLLTCTITFSMLTMMVQEKIRDIGILSAMGAPQMGVGSVFALCGVFVAGVGGAFGLGAGTALAHYVNNVKDAIESTFNIQIFNRDVYAFTEIPVSVNHELNVVIVIVTAVFSVFICLIPAMRAARMDPVEALRHE